MCEQPSCRRVRREGCATDVEQRCRTRRQEHHRSTVTLLHGRGSRQAHACGWRRIGAAGEVARSAGPGGGAGGRRRPADSWHHRAARSGQVDCGPPSGRRAGRHCSARRDASASSSPKVTTCYSNLHHGRRFADSWTRSGSLHPTSKPAARGSPPGTAGTAAPRSRRPGARPAATSATPA